MGNIYVPDTPETREYITKSAVAALYVAPPAGVLHGLCVSL
jgi:hypothetical protein